MKGRKPVPTKLKILRGNPGQRRLPEHEPQPAEQKPRAPAGMSKVQQRIWREVVDALAAVGLLTKLDGKAIAALVYKVWEWQEAKATVEKYGVLIVSKKGNAENPPVVTVNPAVYVEHKAFDQMMRAFTEYGMTASSRSRVQTAAAGETVESSPLVRPKRGAS